MSSTDQFHKGELAVQRRAGDVQMARLNGAALGDRIPGGATPFIAQQPMAVVASVAPDGAVWASVLLGEPGFLQAPDARSIHVDTSQPRAPADDPLWNNIAHDSHLGMLVIELGSRRRLRANGRAHMDAPGELRLSVEQAYPNCPKYIQRRQWSLPPDGTDANHGGGQTRHGHLLDTRQRAWISNADTLFVASAHPEHGADASHRGGRPGFVQIIGDNSLRIPDYSGNSMFNTLGNFECNPYAGLAFIDFERSRLLQLAGHVVIRWDLEDEQQRSGGTGRFWDFEVLRWRETELAMRLNWRFIDFSPFIPQALDEDAALTLQVTEIHRETDRVRRLRLRAFDDAELPAFEPGAHLTVLLPGNDGDMLQRHYSILSDPSERGWYDIAVLKEPASRGGSRYLHESVKPGDQLIALTPRNEFPMTRMAHHAIFIAGGIGITPIFGMLRATARGQGSFELHYSVRHSGDLAFRDELIDLAGDSARFYATREADAGRLPLDEIMAKPQSGTHIYVCGPRRLIVAVMQTAKVNGWPEEQIHFESFGAEPTPDDRPIDLVLARSGRSLVVPANRTILDTVLDAGIAVPYDCRRGECAMCMTACMDGEPEHRDLCLTATEQGRSLCVCVSRAKGGCLVLDL